MIWNEVGYVNIVYTWNLHLRAHILAGMQKLIKGLTRLYVNIARYLIWDVQVLHLLPFCIYFDFMLLFGMVMVEFLLLVRSSWFSLQIPACVSGFVQKILFFLTTKPFITIFFVVVYHCGQGYAEKGKKWVAIFKVKVIMRAYIIRIWQFLLCLLS